MKLSSECLGLSGKLVEVVADWLLARVFVCTTFGLFTEGFDKFDDYYEQGYITKVITTNLTYLPSIVNEKPYFVTADMSKFLALIIDSLNHDVTIGNVLNHRKLNTPLHLQEKNTSLPA